MLWILDNYSSSAAEYLIFVASTGESDASYEIRYGDKSIWLTQNMTAALYDVGLPLHQWTYQKDLFWRRADSGGNYSEIPNSSDRENSAGQPQSESL